jgi:hypothetical protein
VQLLLETAGRRCLLTLLVQLMLIASTLVSQLLLLLVSLKQQRLQDYNCSASAGAAAHPAKQHIEGSSSRLNRTVL